MATNGGISLSDLLQLPVRQLNVLRKAVDLERISWRKQFIMDIAGGFGDPKKAIINLDAMQRRIEADAGVKSIIWTPEENAATKLLKYKR